MLATASKEAVAVVQPRSDETVYQLHCEKVHIDSSQTPVAASSQLIDVGLQRQIPVEQHAEIACIA